MEVSDPIHRLNTALEGRYRIERQLGEGGMATVYLADDLKHERKVALKVLKPELAAVVGAERFLAEIKTTANLQHPHILPLYDSGEADGLLFYVMPFVEGETLRDRVDRDRQLPVDEALGIATAVAAALHTAHERGVVHRDIKPANILLSQGEPLVADFGIALAVGSAGGGRLTETGLSVGTPYYMSPEQATGDQAVGPATDIYALSCVLYEMLVGEPPYLGNTAQAVLGKIIQGIPVSATAARRSIPANVDAAIRKGLEKTPADRFTSARSFAAALADPTFRHGEDADAVVAAATHTRLRRLAVAGWIGAVVGVALAAVAWRSSGPAHEHRVERFGAPFLEGQVPSFTGGAGYDLSPDGSMLVYRHRPTPGATQVLMVRRWDDLAATTVRETEDGSHPAVSPDGLELAFEQGGEVKVLALAGGPVRTLASGSRPVWGPEGWVYFVTDSGTARAPSMGGTVEPVTRLAEGESEHEIYHVLSGGDAALAVVEDLAGSRVVGVDLRTGEMKPIVADADRPRVLPSGHLVYRAGDAMMAARFDPGALELKGPTVPVMDEIGFWSLSDDGKLFYTASGDGGGAWEFVWVTLEGNATAVDPDWVFNPGPSQDHGFSLSPDGLQIAVRHWTSDGFDIWVKRVGGAFSRLTFGAADERAPTWSPDGRSVTFLSDRNGDFDVWTRRADGTGEPELLVDLAVSIESVEWTPDGAYLLLGVDYGDRDVLMLGSGSSEPTPLFTGSWREEAPVVSPDGRWIAYGSTESGRMEVYVRPFPDIDAGRWQVSIDGGRNPRWAHDGTGIFFEGPGPFRALMVAEIQAETGFTHGTPRPLFDSGGAYLGSSRVGQLFRVAPDGERFLLATSPDAAGGVTAGPRVVLVNNFLEELRRIVPD